MKLLQRPLEWVGKLPSFLGNMINSLLQLTCKHEPIFLRRDGRVWVECLHCQWKSKGWEVTFK